MNYKLFDPKEERDSHDEELWLYVYGRDDGFCQADDCGCEGSEEHHILYKSHGGKNKANNLVLLCKKHHHEEHSIKAGSKDYYRNRVRINELRFRDRLV